MDCPHCHRSLDAEAAFCPSRTPESAWVSQEVELFASFHGRGHIFVALAEGEPAESLPPFLGTATSAEPTGDAPVETSASGPRCELLVFHWAMTHSRLCEKSLTSKRRRQAMGNDKRA